jgi:hypothetical protein
VWKSVERVFGVFYAIQNCPTSHIAFITSNLCEKLFSLEIYFKIWSLRLVLVTTRDLLAPNLFYDISMQQSFIAYQNLSQLKSVWRSGAMCLKLSLLLCTWGCNMPLKSISGSLYKGNWTQTILLN